MTGLDAGPSDILGEVEALGDAGRRVVTRGDLTHRQKLLVILELAERSGKSEWAFAAQQALWAAVRDFLGESARNPAVVPDPVERACRGLLARNIVRCPTCERVLPGERDLERWRILRHATVDEARRKEARCAS